jgi:hypothetical protein
MDGRQEQVAERLPRTAGVTTMTTKQMRRTRTGLAESVIRRVRRKMDGRRGAPSTIARKVAAVVMKLEISRSPLRSSSRCFGDYPSGRETSGRHPAF